jgi:hypothetical protein
LCPVNTFTSSIGTAIQCTICATGTQALIPGATKCDPKTCSAGSGLSNGACATCPAGQYSDGTLACAPCAVGTFSKAGASSCSACPANTYTGKTGTADQCTACASGSTSFPGSSSCSTTSCSPGNYLDILAGSCKQCPAGSFSLDGIAACAPCLPGSFSTAGSASCTPCAIGTATLLPGTPNSCPACPSGLTTYSTGQSICVLGCPAGSEPVLFGIGGCSVCPAGKYSSNGLACQACPAGQTNNAAHTACQVAPSIGLTKSRRSMVCDAGRTACAIGGGPKVRAFECVDTMNDIQSCGGCWSTGAGVDCTAFDDRATATCVRGQCQCE